LIEIELGIGTGVDLDKGTGRMEMNRQLFGKAFSLGDIHPSGSPEGPSQLRAECLVATADPEIEITVRFGQSIERQIVDATGAPVRELVVTGRRYTSGRETLEREVRLSGLPNRTAAIETAGDERAEMTENGAPAGAQVWWWEPQHGTVEAWTEEVRPGLFQVRVEVANRLEWDRATPAQNSLRTLRSTQLAMHSPDDSFSLGHLPTRPRRSAHPALR
jgi:hypothetical protein